MKVGDKVLINTDLSKSKIYQINVSAYMQSYAGKILTINDIGINNEKDYITCVECPGYIWSFDTFTLVPKTFNFNIALNSPIKIIFQYSKETKKGATILYWNDKDKTIIKLAQGDKFNKRIGFLWAYTQKHSGMSKTKFNKFIDYVRKDSIEDYLKLIFKEQTKLSMIEIEKLLTVVTKS